MRNTYITKDGFKTEGDSSFINIFRKVENEFADNESKWIESLRKKGIKAAHPDDGWIDRENNIAILTYPQFNDGLEVGDKLALGWFDKARIVKIKKITKGLVGLTYYHFSHL